METSFKNFFQHYVNLTNAELLFRIFYPQNILVKRKMSFIFLVFCYIGQISVANSREIPSFDYLNKILKNDGGVCGSTCAEFNSMLSQLILDLDVVRSLVSQNGQKIGKIETDIQNKSEENQNAHQDIEGTNSYRHTKPIVRLKFSTF